MSAPAAPRGQVFRCPVCGAEVVVLTAAGSSFRPRCCNVAMLPQAPGVRFFRCPDCGAEVAVLHDGGGTFRPRCCNKAMVDLGA